MSSETNAGVEAAGAGARIARKQRPAIADLQRSARPGLLMRLFGTPLALWGAKNRTLESGLWGRHPKLSAAARSLLARQSPEDAVLTASALKFAVVHGWKELEPPTYNCIVAAHRLFMQYLNGPQLVQASDDPARLATLLAPFSESYLAVRQFPNPRSILLSKMMEFLRGQEGKLRTGCLPAVEEAMRILCGETDSRPDLGEVVLALHCIAGIELRTTEDLQLRYRPPAPELKRFAAPEPVAGEIRTHVSGLRSSLQKATEELRRLDRIEQKYLPRGDNDKLDLTWLERTLSDIRDTLPGIKADDPASLASYLSSPPRLLLLAIRDLESSLEAFAGGMVPTMSGQRREEVWLFRRDLFSRQLDLLRKAALRAEQLARPEPDPTLSLENFHKRRPESTGGGQDRFEVALFQTVDFTLQVVRDLRESFERILENDERARSLDTGAATGPATPEATAIETINQAARHLPYAERSLVMKNRFGELTVRDALVSLLRNMFAYGFLLGDRDLLELLRSRPTLEERRREIREQLTAIGENE